MSASSIKAGDAFVEVYADKNPLVRGLKQSAKTIGSFVRKANQTLSKVGDGMKNVGTKLAGAGAALAGAGGLGIGKALGSIEGLAKVDQMAKSFGLTAEAATGLFGVFKAHGSDARSSMESLVTMSGAIKDALSGGETGAKLFEGLSVTAQELQGLDPAEQFYRLHAALLELEDPMERNAKLAIMFGEDGMKDLLPVLNKSNAELREMADGFSMTQEELDRARDAQAAMNKVSASFQRIWDKIAIAMAPHIETIAGHIDKLFKIIAQPQIIKWLSWFIMGLTAAGIALVTIGGSLAIAGAALSGLSTILGGLGVAISYLFTPTGLIVAGVAAAVAAFLTFTDSGQAMMKSAKGYLSRLGSIFEETLEGMKNGLMNGNIQGAMDVLWAGLRLSWLEGTNFIREAWVDLKEILAGTMIILAGQVEKVFAGITNGIITAINLAIKAINSIFGTTYSLIDKIETGDIDGRTQDTLDMNGEMAQAQRDALKDELENARKSLDEALGRANKPVPVEAPKPGDSPADKQEEQIRAGSQNALNSASIVGTSGAANAVARFLSGTDASEWQKKTYQETKKQTKALNDLKDSGVVLGIG